MVHISYMTGGNMEALFVDGNLNVQPNSDPS